MPFRTSFSAFRGATQGFSSAFRTSAQTSGGARRGYSQAPPYGPSAFRKWGTRLALAIALPGVYVLGAAFPPKVVLLLYPRYSPPPPSSESTQGKALMGETESELQKLYIVARLRNKVGWYESRPYAKYDPDKVHNSLTAGSLRGPGKLAIPPIVFAKEDESEAIAVIHLGRALCGHDGIIHGGIISTVFDESLARNALLNLPSHIGVTANLNVNFRSPLHADQFVILRTKLDTVNGRKVTVSGSMETLEGEKVAEATALFIEPKWAQFLQSSGVTEALGRPMPQPFKSPAVLDGATERII